MPPSSSPTQSVSRTVGGLPPLSMGSLENECLYHDNLPPKCKSERKSRSVAVSDLDPLDTTHHPSRYSMTPMRSRSSSLRTFRSIQPVSPSAMPCGDTPKILYDVDASRRPIRMGPVRRESCCTRSLTPPKKNKTKKKPRGARSVTPKRKQRPRKQQPQPCNDEDDTLVTQDTVDSATELEEVQVLKQALTYFRKQKVRITTPTKTSPLVKVPVTVTVAVVAYCTHISLEATVNNQTFTYTGHSYQRCRLGRDLQRVQGHLYLDSEATLDTITTETFRLCTNETGSMNIFLNKTCGTASAKVTPGREPSVVAGQGQWVQS